MDYQSMNTPANAAATALQNRVAGDLQTCRDTPPALVTVVLALRADLQRIAGDKKISPLAMVQQREDARSRAASAVDRLQDSAQRAADAIRATCDAVIAPPMSTQDALLRELQEQSAWNRAQMALAAGKPENATAVVQQLALSAGDPAMAAALRKNLPYWVLGQSSDPRDARARNETLQAVLDQAEAPTLSAELRMARSILAEVQGGMANLAGAFNYVRDEVAGNGVHRTIAAWEKGQSVRVAEPLPATPPIYRSSPTPESSAGLYRNNSDRANGLGR